MLVQNLEANIQVPAEVIPVGGAGSGSSESTGAYWESVVTGDTPIISDTLTYTQTATVTAEIPTITSNLEIIQNVLRYTPAIESSAEESPYSINTILSTIGFCKLSPADIALLMSGINNRPEETLEDFWENFRISILENAFYLDPNSPNGGYRPQTCDPFYGSAMSWGPVNTASDNVAAIISYLDHESVPNGINVTKGGPYLVKELVRMPDGKLHIEFYVHDLVAGKNPTGFSTTVAIPKDLVIGDTIFYRNGSSDQELYASTTVETGGTNKYLGILSTNGGIPYAGPQHPLYSIEVPEGFTQADLDKINMVAIPITVKSPWTHDTVWAEYNGTPPPPESLFAPIIRFFGFQP